MKMSIRWHKDSLDNFRRSLEEQRENFRRVESALVRTEAQFNAAFEQYEEAIRRGVDGYDSDKFWKKRK